MTTLFVMCSMSASIVKLLMLEMEVFNLIGIEQTKTNLGNAAFTTW